jgi:hypothetical protein
VEWNHDFEAAGSDLEEVKPFDSRADGSAADLLDDADAMVGVNDLVAYVENVVASHGRSIPPDTLISLAAGEGEGKSAFRTVPNPESGAWYSTNSQDRDVLRPLHHGDESIFSGRANNAIRINGLRVPGSQIAGTSISEEIFAAA